MFRAAHAVPDEDTRPTGPHQQPAADRRAQQALDERISHALDTSYGTAWLPLGTQVGLTPAADPHWPALVENLAALSRAGADAPALLRAAAAQAPLPDEYRAAAIWWRIAARVSPAVLTPDRDSAPADPLRPDWLPTLTANLGQPTTERLLGDPHWPAVITAIHRALAHGTPLPDLLRAATGHDGHPVPDHALADALIYQAFTLAQPVPDSPDQQPEDPARTPPEDLHMLTTTLDPNTPVNSPEEPTDYSHVDEGQLDQAPTPAEDTVPATELALPEPELHEALFQAAHARQWMRAWEPTPEQLERALARAAEADLSPVSPERIADLNEQTARFFQDRYRGSWAQAYLTDRLAGTDLTGDPRTRPGYAPAGWTTLTTQLRRHGATDQELLAAGLAKRASTGRLIDTFRDRLLLPIHHRGQIVGFVGRRNPATDNLDADTQTSTANSGPKYLNTRETVLFSKGQQLYGMGEHADRLAAGAAPVLVEGPIDALAVTLTSADHVGVAPLGTALTDTQADTLLPYLDTAAGAPGVIVATDPDLAGQLAAERAYWMLTARGADPRHATLPPGQDPAGLLHSNGPTALRQQLQNARSLADALIAERLSNLPPAAALTAALQIAAAGHAQHWSARTADIARRLHAPEDVALTELLGHICAWDKDRQEASTRQIRDIPTTRNRITALANQKPAQRWAPLARQIDPTLARAHDWGALADAIDRSHKAGDDVRTLLPQLAAQAPLCRDEPAKDLRYRLTARLDDPEEPMTRRSTAQTTRPRLNRPPATEQTPSPKRAPNGIAPGHS